MSWHDPISTLRQMRSFAIEARDLLADRSLEQLNGDRVLSLALTRLMELVGESATRIEVDVQERHPEIPLREIIGLRHRLIHGYDSINL